MTNDWQSLYLESVKSRAALEPEIDELRSQVLEALTLKNDLAAITAERDALKAELEKEKAKALKAQEVADWHMSHRTLAESKLEAARKQEPPQQMKLPDDALYALDPLYDKGEYYISGADINDIIAKENGELCTK